MTLDDVLAVTGGNEPLESDHETLAAVAGYRDAMTYVLQLSDDPHFDYSEALIRSLHFMIVKHDLRKSPGRWRPGAIYVHSRDEIVYEGPDALPCRTWWPSWLRSSANATSTSPH